MQCGDIDSVSPPWSCASYAWSCTREMPSTAPARGSLRVSPLVSRSSVGKVEGEFKRVVVRADARKHDVDEQMPQHDVKDAEVAHDESVEQESRRPAPSIPFHGTLSTIFSLSWLRQRPSASTKSMCTRPAEGDPPRCASSSSHSPPPLRRAQRESSTRCEAPRSATAYVPHPLRR